MPSRSKLVDAAADLNEVMQLKDPAIDLKQPVGSLIEQIKEAAQLLKPDDQIKSATQDVIDELREMDEEGGQEAAPPPAATSPPMTQTRAAPTPVVAAEPDPEPEPEEDEEPEDEPEPEPAPVVRRARRPAAVAVTVAEPEPVEAAPAPKKRAQRSQAAQPAPAAPAKVARGVQMAKTVKAPARAGQGRNGLGEAASQKYQGSMSQRYDRILLRGGLISELADENNLRMGYLRMHARNRHNSGHYLDGRAGRRLYQDRPGHRSGQTACRCRLRRKAKTSQPPRVKRPGRFCFRGQPRRNHDQDSRNPSPRSYQA